MLTLLFHLLAALGFTTLILFFYLFPDARFVPGWALLPALAWVANDCVEVFYPKLFAAYRWGDIISFGLFFAPALCAVGSQIYRYRSISGPEQRQQTKWVIFGTSIGFGGFLVLVALQGILPGFEKPGVLGGLFGQTITTVLFLMIPLSIGVAILRSRLFDIDVVINRALVYALLTTALVLVYAGSVVGLQFVFRVVKGQETQLAVVASTLVIAVLFNPMRHRIQAFIDRLFYRRKYDTSLILAACGIRLREEVDLRALGDDLLEVVRETVQPAHATLWLRSSDGESVAEEREL